MSPEKEIETILKTNPPSIHNEVDTWLQFKDVKAQKNTKHYVFFVDLIKEICAISPDSNEGWKFLLSVFSGKSDIEKLCYSFKLKLVEIFFKSHLALAEIYLAIDREIETLKAINELNKFDREIVDKLIQILTSHARKIENLCQQEAEKVFHSIKGTSFKSFQIDHPRNLTNANLQFYELESFYKFLTELVQGQSNAFLIKWMNFIIYELFVTYDIDGKEKTVQDKLLVLHDFIEDIEEGWQALQETDFRCPQASHGEKEKFITLLKEKRKCLEENPDKSVKKIETKISDFFESSKGFKNLYAEKLKKAVEKIKAIEIALQHSFNRAQIHLKMERVIRRLNRVDKDLASSTHPQAPLLIKLIDELKSTMLYQWEERTKEQSKCLDNFENKLKNKDPDGKIRKIISLPKSINRFFPAELAKEMEDLSKRVPVYLTHIRYSLDDLAHSLKLIPSSDYFNEIIAYMLADYVDWVRQLTATKIEAETIKAYHHYFLIMKELYIESEKPTDPAFLQHFDFISTILKALKQTYELCYSNETVLKTGNEFLETRNQFFAFVHGSVECLLLILPQQPLSPNQLANAEPNSFAHTYLGKLLAKLLHGEIGSFDKEQVTGEAIHAELLHNQSFKNNLFQLLDCTITIAQFYRFLLPLDPHQMSPKKSQAVDKFAALFFPCLDALKMIIKIIPTWQRESFLMLKELGKVQVIINAEAKIEQLYVIVQKLEARLAETTTNIRTNSIAAISEHQSLVRSSTKITHFKLKDPLIFKSETYKLQNSKNLDQMEVTGEEKTYYEIIKDLITKGRCVPQSDERFIKIEFDKIDDAKRFTEALLKLGFGNRNDTSHSKKIEPILADLSPNNNSADRFIVELTKDEWAALHQSSEGLVLIDSSKNEGITEHFKMSDNNNNNVSSLGSLYGKREHSDDEDNAYHDLGIENDQGTHKDKIFKN